MADPTLDVAVPNEPFGANDTALPTQFVDLAPTAPTNVTSSEPVTFMVDRKVLLPPYMAEQQAWTDLADAISEVFQAPIDVTTQFLRRLREVWMPSDSDDVQAKIGNYQLLSSSEFQTWEREILIKQTNMLGFAFKETDLLSDFDYQNLTRNIALYWYSKGKPDFIDFLSFVLNNVLSVQRLWSTQAGVNGDQYGDFLPDGDPGIGTPVWLGGAWFPTTHVQITLDISKFSQASVPKIVALFYAIANYNLVIENILLIASMAIHSVDDPVLANIVVCYPSYDIEYQIATV